MLGDGDPFSVRESNMCTPCRLLAALLLLAAVARAEPPAAPDTSADEQLLKDAGIKTDGLALVEFLHKRVPAEATPEKLAALVKQLGDDEFSVRDKASEELRALGARALPALRRAASDPDEEVKRRSLDCIAATVDGPGAARTAAAARLLAAGKPAGAAGALLTYLPFAEDEAAADEIVCALVAVGAPGGRPDPALGDALADRDPARRAAAALLLGRHGSAEQKTAVRKLLADADPNIRLRAAQGLLAGREKAALPPLLTLLGDAPPDLARQAEDLLQRAAGTTPPAVPWGADKDQRARCRAAWEAWWKEKESQLDLAKADVDLEVVNLSALARETTRRLVVAWFEKGDDATVKKMLDPPIRIERQTFATRQQLDEIILLVCALIKQEKQKAKVTVLEAAAPDEFLRQADDEMRKALKGLPKSELRVVYVKLANDQTHGFVVHVRGARGKVVAIGAAREVK
jgi:HEAT repeat protein